MKYTYIKNILLGVLLICTTATCCCPSESNDSNGSNNHETSRYFPGKDWETTSPETQGYSSEKFAALKAEIEKKYSTTHLMIVVEGKLFSLWEISLIMQGLLLVEKAYCQCFMESMWKMALSIWMLH